MSRRRFLELLGALSAMVLLPNRILAALGTPSRAPETAAGMASTHAPVAGLDGVDAVGSAYLSERPGEASPEFLRAALGLRSGEDPTTRSGRMARRIVADFEADDVVSLDGWRLSRSEARLAALLHLERYD